MAATEVRFIVTSTGTNTILVPVAGQGVKDFGIPLTQLRLQFNAADSATIGFAVNQVYIVTIDKL